MPEVEISYGIRTQSNLFVGPPPIYECFIEGLLKDLSARLISFLSVGSFVDREVEVIKFASLTAEVEQPMGQISKNHIRNLANNRQTHIDRQDSVNDSR